MISSPEPNKATPNSDSPNRTATLGDELPPQSPQQAAEVDFRKLNLQNAENLVTDRQEQTEHQKVPLRLSRGLSLRAKATALAIALGTLPVLGIGATAYYFANREIVKQIKQDKQSRATEIADKANRFIFERYGDIQIMANLPIFTNSNLLKVTTTEEKQATLERFRSAYEVYDSIAVIDLNGNVIAQSQGTPLPNLRDRTYFQQVLKTDKPLISNPEISKSSGDLVLHFAAPVKDAITGKTIAVVRSRMPVKYINEVIKGFGANGDTYHLFDSSKKYFVVKEKQDLGADVLKDFPSVAHLLGGEKVASEVMTDSENHTRLVTYTASGHLEGLPDLNWGVLLTTVPEVAFAPQRQLLLTLAIGTGVAALLVSVIAIYLANRATRPILAATSAVEKLGQGKFDTRIAVKGEDELAVLGSNINRMADQLQILLQGQADEAERASLLKDIAVRIGQFINAEDIFKTPVEEIRLALKTDRVVVYGFNEKWQGTVIAESVAEGWPRAMGAKIDDPCFADRYVERYRKGRVQPTENIYAAGLNECHINQLEQFAVKANLVAPILQGSKLLGLLIAHQCSGPRAWQQPEIDLFAQVATQVGFGLDRANLLEQQKSAKEKLQRRALELMMEVDPVSKGDLTIRANVTEDEIGTVADSYNATINSLRKIVTQVQTAAKQVTATTSSSEVSVQELSAEALRQAEEVATALARIQAMSNSMRSVANSAEQAEAAVKRATQTVEAGDTAMNRTVEGILAIRETVAETSEKVKRLGESSQKISKVVKLINTFADQTNLLALNAAIEAARAGEEGRGFAVVADEVGSLALQSAEATAEIEKLVADIQAETIEVVAAMEAGTEQVVTGTKLVDETRQSLNQITAASAQISALVQAIASAAVEQSQASEEVTQTMTDMAESAQHTSNEATVVSASFKELLAVAQQLQASVGQFKVS